MEGVATSERVTALGSCHSEYVLQTRSSHCGTCSSPRIWVIVHILRVNYRLQSFVSAKSDLAVLFLTWEQPRTLDFLAAFRGFGFCIERHMTSLQ